MAVALTVQDPMPAMPSYAEEARAIWSMGWKVSLATLCQVSQSTISMAFLGHLGSNEMAAAALAGIWINGVQMLNYGFAITLCTLCGNAFGAKNYDLVGIWLQLGLLVMLAFSLPVMLSFFFVDHVLAFVTDDIEVLNLAGLFARWLIPTVIPQAVYCALQQYLQAQQILTPVTIVSVLSVGVCLVSNQVLVYGLGPIPALHFIGSPIAQCVASLFQPLALWAYAFKYKGLHKQTWPGFQIKECLKLERMYSFFTMSIGMMINTALDEWVYNVLSSLAATMGPTDLAANSVLFNLWGMIYGVVFGFGLPTQVRAANFLGANEPGAAKRTMHVGFVMGGVLSLGMIVALYAFQNTVISFYTPDAEIANLVGCSIPIFCLAVFASGQHVLLEAIVEAMSLATMLVAVTICGSWVVMLPMSYLLGVVLQNGLQGLWWGSVCGEIVKVVLMAMALNRIDWPKMALRAMSKADC